jgi:hypothetical protein
MKGLEHRHALSQIATNRSAIAASATTRRLQTERDYPANARRRPDWLQILAFRPALQTSTGTRCSSRRARSAHKRRLGQNKGCATQAAHRSSGPLTSPSPQHTLRRLRARTPRRSRFEQGGATTATGRPAAGPWTLPPRSAHPPRSDGLPAHTRRPVRDRGRPPRSGMDGRLDGTTASLLTAGGGRDWCTCTVRASASRADLGAEAAPCSAPRQRADAMPTEVRT